MSLKMMATVCAVSALTPALILTPALMVILLSCCSCAP